MAKKVVDPLAILNDKLRLPIEEDKINLPRFSYSKIDTFLTCPYSYYLKYVKGIYPPSQAIFLELGTLCHLILELKAKFIQDKKEVNYNFLLDILNHGTTEAKNGEVNIILGVDGIKRKYGFDTWLTPDAKSGMNYEEKVKLFWETSVCDKLGKTDLHIFGSELPIELVYKYAPGKEVFINGYIDAVFTDDIDNPAMFSIVDYKTGKAKFRDEDIKTSLQQGIYGLYMYAKYGILPSEYRYLFILINEIQEANTKGYLNRLLSKLDRTFLTIDECTESGIFVPKPSPLCYYCNYTQHNPDSSEEYNDNCDYNSLWTPDNKTYATNRKFGEDKVVNVWDEEPKRSNDTGISKRRLLDW